jgi:hypothetical protein
MPSRPATYTSRWDATGGVENSAKGSGLREVSELARAGLGTARSLLDHHPWMTGRRAVYRRAATTSQWLAYSATTITGWSGNVSQVSRNAALKSSGWPTLDAGSVALLNAKRRGVMGSKETASVTNAAN